MLPLNEAKARGLHRESTNGHRQRKEAIQPETQRGNSIWGQINCSTLGPKLGTAFIEEIPPFTSSPKHSFSHHQHFDCNPKDGIYSDFPFSVTLLCRSEGTYGNMRAADIGLRKAAYNCTKCQATKKLHSRNAARFEKGNTTTLQFSTFPYFPHSLNFLRNSRVQISDATNTFPPFVIWHSSGPETWSHPTRAAHTLVMTQTP